MENILKINQIRNMAVFQDFQWNSSVRDEGSNIAEFKKINILYGRNYSGKTTLSRIFRAIETGYISDKYDRPEFELSFSDGNKITQNDFKNCDQIVRVFNEDFVKDNLRFITDDEEAINSFAILGKDNTKIEGEVEKLEAELGNEESNSGLFGEFLDVKNKFNDVQFAYKKKSSELERKLRDKARVIKNNRTFDDTGYNIRKIEADITTVAENSYSPLTNDNIDKFHDLLREAPKNEIPESSSFNLQYSIIASKAKELIEKKIQASDPIQELLNDVALANWVKTGREHHQGKRNKCAFCGGNIPSDLWEKLDKHFNQESEDLQRALDNMLTTIKSERTRIPNLLEIKNSEFYSNFTNDLDLLIKLLSTRSISYCTSLDLIEEQVKKRKNDIFTPLSFDEPKFVEDALNTVRDSFEQLRKKSNQFTHSLNNEQSKARAALRLHEVHKFIQDIKYEHECNGIESLKKSMSTMKKLKDIAEKKVDTKRQHISDLKAQLIDESKGADQVNDYLNNFFGHQSLSLKAVKKNSAEGVSGYRFEVNRNEEKAFHLSEGERSLIAFCYFMAKLEDIETKGSQPIIWIDDPISSLDANHVFFVYTLIRTKIVHSSKFLQLFISTHNLDFLKYLKRISSDYKKKNGEKVKIREFFLVERLGSSSRICKMPNYLKNYITEFNYLFHQIYKCAKAKITDENFHVFYNFGNNARKFMEIYLYYKYPNGIEGDNKLLKFYGEDSVPEIFTSRVNNEYSHLGSFERGAIPVDIPEMQVAAKSIISRIKTIDYDQYNSLLQSINEKDEPPSRFIPS